MGCRWRRWMEGEEEVRRSAGEGEGGDGRQTAANTIWPLLLPIPRFPPLSLSPSSILSLPLPLNNTVFSHPYWSPTLIPCRQPLFVTLCFLCLNSISSKSTVSSLFTMAAPGQPSPQQIAAMQQQFAAEAAKRGMTPEEFAKQQREQLNAEAAKHGMTTEQYVTQLRMRAMAAHQKQVEAQRQAQAGSPQPGQPPQGQPQPQQQQTTHQVPVNPSNPPDPKAIAVAQFLRSQNLKTRTCIMDGQRKDMFKGWTLLFPSFCRLVH